MLTINLLVLISKWHLPVYNKNNVTPQDISCSLENKTVKYGKSGLRNAFLLDIIPLYKLLQSLELLHYI